MTKIEAVEAAVIKWKKRVKGQIGAGEVICSLCLYTRKSNNDPSRCELCPMIGKWPIACEQKKKGTTTYCTDNTSAWCSYVYPTTENDKLILQALEKLLKELEDEEKAKGKHSSTRL